jgi:hypothetical protein
MVPRSKAPMPMGAGEARRSRKTEPLQTPSIKRPLKEPRRRCKLRTVPRLMARRVKTATAPPWVRPQTATSMRQQTATPIKTLAVVGRIQMEVPTPLLPGAMEGRKRAADRRPSVEAAAEAGNPGRRVRVVLRVEAAVGVAGEPSDAAANERNVGERLRWKLLQ